MITVAFLNWGLLINLTLFMVFVVAISFVIGVVSGSMSLGAWGAFLVWIHLALETGDSLFMGVLYIAVVGVLIFAGTRLVSSATGGGEEV